MIGALPILASSASGDDPPRADRGPVNLWIVFMTDMGNAQLSVDLKPVAEWTKQVIAAVETRFKDEKAKRSIVVQITLHPKAPADVEIAGRPAVSAEEKKAILAVADAAKAPSTKMADVCFRLVADINGGHPDKAMSLIPKLESPEEAMRSRLEAASTAQKLALLARWSREQAIPLLAAAGNAADAKFVGVRNLGKMLSSIDLKAPIDVEKWTEQSPDYWRAMMEMVPGNPLVLTSRVVLHIANGELDKASRLADIASSMFDEGKSGPSTLLLNARRWIAIAQEDIAARIKKGVALHDMGKFAAALEIYEAVLKDCPKSAWARYERFQTRRALSVKNGKSIEEAQTSWPVESRAIYGCDPLFPHSAGAASGEELYEIFRRTESRELFQDRAKGAEDVIKYADIALDLGAYGYAAPIYWRATTGINPKAYGDRAILEYFLYCLEQLGTKTIKEHFKGDHAAAFTAIKTARRKLMEDSDAFKAMINQSREAKP